MMTFVVFSQEHFSSRMQWEILLSHWSLIVTLACFFSVQRPFSLEAKPPELLRLGRQKPIRQTAAHKQLRQQQQLQLQPAGRPASNRKR